MWKWRRYQWLASVTMWPAGRAVQESRERVQTAVKNAGLHFPRHVWLSSRACRCPQEGPAYDIPMRACHHLRGYLRTMSLYTIVVGELSLDGVVRHTRGVLSMAATARANGFKRMFVPETDAGEAALIPDLEIIPVRSLADLYAHLSGRRLIEPFQPSNDELESLFVPTDFSEVKGQEHVKRPEVAPPGDLTYYYWFARA